jgi:hypothetical protein
VITDNGLSCAGMLPFNGCLSSKRFTTGLPTSPSTSYRTESLLLTTEDTSQSIRAAFVTPDFIKAVREKPLLGRSFIAEEHRPKGQPVVVLSQGLWQQRFGAESAVIGKSVAFNGRAHTIVGVMPGGFNVPAGADAWLPEVGSDR